MKAFKLLTVLLIAMTMLTGCDFFRSILGKPTSKDIERMRIEAEAQAKKQRHLDSINRAKALELEAIAVEEEVVALSESSKRYHVVLGSFKVEANASRMYAMLEKNGYEPKDIKFRNGFDLVSVASFSGYRVALRELDKLRAYNFCPEDVWIYDTEQGLHEQ